MSYAPATISDVFRVHGITISIGSPMMRIQKLAMAITLQGRYQIDASYLGGGHSMLVNVWEPRVVDNDPGDPWRLLRRLSATLPSQDSSASQREIAIESLNDMVAVLEQLLQEGPQS